MKVGNHYMSNNKTTNVNDIVQFANDRPTSLDDDLYQWAIDSESMLRDLNAENESLKDWIREEGYRSNTCTWNILREKCSYCQCNRKGK